MLSMKTLRVAIVTMGSALLLGPGLASAIDLDGPAADNPPLTYALESLGAATETIMDANMNVTHYGLAQDTALEFTATTSLRLEGSWFLRVELGGGLVFQDTIAAPSGWERAQGGGAGDAQAVYSLGTSPVDIEDAVTLVVTDNLAVPAAAGAHTAEMTLHSTLNDALDGVGETSMDFFGGSATVIVVASGVDADIVAGAPLTASVDTGFLWFLGPSNSEMLGTFHAVANPMGVLAAEDGQQAEENDVIAMGDMAVGLTVEGNLTIGAFTVVGQMEDDVNTADVDESEMLMACPAAPAMPVEDPENNLMGNLVNPDDAEADVTDMGSAMRAAGMYGLCVNVDVAGPMTNTSALPAGDYMATLSVTGAGEGAEAMEVASKSIGSIVRDGASVQIAYLTTSDKHNQRLIIVNRGNRPISITDIAFQTEDGTEASLSELAMAAAMIPGAGEIGSGETAVHSVKQMLSITGDSTRTAATLSFNGRSQDITVATTLVNPEIRATDTVVYEVK
jgi:hypothetical protein